MSDPNDALVDSWLLAIHDRSEGTRDLYARTLGYFRAWLAETGRTADLLAVTRRDCDAWFTAMGDLAANTRRSRWIALRSFYGWLAEEDEIDANPMAKVKVGRPDEPPPPVLAVDQLKALLKVCEGKAFPERRDTALVRTFLSTGVRLGEAAALRLEDVDLQTRVLVVRRGKGGKRRVARFDSATAASLDRYRRSRARHRHADRPQLWLGQKGPLTDAGVAAALERRATAAGVEGFHVHLLRHTWADRWKSAGGSEEDLARLGGWEDLRVMRRYGAARAVDRALAAYDAVDPMAGL